MSYSKSTLNSCLKNLSLKSSYVAFECPTSELRPLPFAKSSINSPFRRTYSSIVCGFFPRLILFLFVLSSEYSRYFSFVYSFTRLSSCRLYSFSYLIFVLPPVLSSPIFFFSAALSATLSIQFSSSGNTSLLLDFNALSSPTSFFQPFFTPSFAFFAASPNIFMSFLNSGCNSIPKRLKTGFDLSALILITLSNPLITIISVMAPTIPKESSIIFFLHVP